MIIKNLGFELDQFYIPPFELNKGELLNLYIFSGGHFFDLEQKLTAIFSGELNNKQVIVNEPLQFVENFYDFKYGNLLFPVTVKKFLNKTANQENLDEIGLIKELDFSKNPKLIKIPAYERRILGLISALSKSKNLTFDLTGLDPINALTFLKKIKNVTENSGSAILINNFDDRTERDYCDKHVAIRTNKNCA